MQRCVFLFIVAWRQTLLSIYLFDHRPIFVYFYVNSAQKPDAPPLSLQQVMRCIDSLC